MGRGRPRVAMIAVQCSGCPTMLERYPAQVERSRTGRWFCSTECRNRVGSKPRRKAMCQCQRDGCNVEFYPHSGPQANLYCSRACTDLAHRIGTDRVCAFCEGEFYAPPSVPDMHCSRRCYDDARATPLGTQKPTSDGYVLVWRPDSPEAQATGWALAHRVVMAEVLGHALLPESTVHHRNGQRDDNRPRNLELRAGAHGAGQTVIELLDWARELIATYGQDEARLRELAPAA